MKKKFLSALIVLTMVLSVVSPMTMMSTVSADAAPLASYNVSISSPYATPTVTPPAGVHPRVMVRDAYVDKVRENWDNAENASAVTEFERLADASIDPDESVGTLNADNSYKRDRLRMIEAKAFDYLLNKDSEDAEIKERAKANGSYAVVAMEKFLATASYASESDVCRESGYAIFIASEVYDWCYDKMIKNEYDYAKKIIYRCENLMKSGNAAFEVGYPPTGGRNVTGHAGEFMLFRDMLAFAIAIYDEKPEVYNYVMGRIEYDMAPARKWFYESKAPYQGDAYGAERYLGELYAETLIEKMTWTDSKVFIDSEHKGFKQVPRHWLYMHRPDGRLFTRGDDFTIPGGVSGYNSKNFFAANFMAGNLFSDAYVKGESYRRISKSGNVYTVDFTGAEFTDNKGITSVKWLIMNDPAIPTQITNRTALDKSKYFGSPSGEIVAKTSWTYGVHNAADDYMSNDAAAAYMRIGEYYGGNHDDLDSGSFQLYYKGILASASGYYDSYGSEHTKNYRKRTISHNALTISSTASLEDSDAGSDIDAFFGVYETSNGWWTTGTATNPHSNDGGQRIASTEIDSLSVWQNASGKYKRAEVLDHYVSDDYSYIKGNLTKAYAPAKVDQSVPIIRNMAFVNTGNSDVPAFMIVYDRVKGASSSNVPQFNLHTQTEPTISGTTTTVVNGGGKMTVKTLLPASASITKLGGSGNEYKVAGTNYTPTKTGSGAELGWGRIEIKPTSASGTTEFLNVLAVSDSGYTTDIPATKIEGTNVKGARVLDDVVLFSSGSGRVNSSASFTVSGSDTNLSMKVLGIKPGYWLVKKDGTTIAMPKVEEDEDGNGATLAFTGDAGAYTLEYVSAEVHWQNIFSTGFESGSDWETYFTESASGTKGVPGEVNYANNTGDDLEAKIKRIAHGRTGSGGALTRTLELNATASPLYNNDKADIVRISFDIAGDTTDSSYPTHIRLVGESGGETITTTTTYADNRFILISGNRIYSHDENSSDGGLVENLHSFAANKWYKIVVEVNCITDTYDIYIYEGNEYDGKFGTGFKLGADFDKIYGISVTGLGKGGTKSAVTKQVFVDNIRYDVLMTGEVVQSNVTLNTNGGTINAGNITSYTEGEMVSLPTNVTKEGYTFGGWYENSSFTGSAVTSIPASATGDKTYYAKWLAVYNITLNANGGTINAGNVTSYIEGTGATLPTNVTKSGYTFEGWYDNSSFTGSAVTSIPTSATGNKTYYAKWELETYTIEYVLNGGEVSGTPTESYQTGTAVSLPANVTRSGFTFDGWYYDRFFTEGPIAQIPATETGSKTMYAKYTKTGRTDAEITDNYIVAAFEDFNKYEADAGTFYSGTFDDGFANLGGSSADYTTYICENPYGDGRGNVLGLRHSKTNGGTTLYWGLDSTPAIPQGARNDFKKVKISFDSSRGFASQSYYQLDLILDGEDASNNAVEGKPIARISTGRSINYMPDGTTAKLTSVTMPRNEWVHIDVYVDTENHLFSIYQDSLPLAENIALEGDMLDFDEITGFKLRSVTKNGATEDAVEYVDNVKFAVLANSAKVRPIYTKVFDMNFNSSPYEYYNTADAGMVSNGSLYIDDDPAGLRGKVARLRHTSATVSAEMTRSGEGSALGSNSKDEFRCVKFGFDHYVTIPDADSTSTPTTYYQTDLVIYGDTEESTGLSSAIGMFTENAVLELYDGATAKAVGTYARDKWQRLEFYVDCLEGTYDAYLDGHIVAEGFALPQEYDYVYAIRISAHKLGSRTDSYTYIDNIEFYKGPEIREGIELSADAYFDDGYYAYSVGASGFTKSTNAYVLIAIYNPNHELMYLRKEAFAEETFEDEDELEGVSEGTYLKAFAWDMQALAPLGETITVSNE